MTIIVDSDASLLVRSAYDAINHLGESLVLYVGLCLGQLAIMHCRVQLRLVILQNLVLKGSGVYIMFLSQVNQGLTRLEPSLYLVVGNADLVHCLYNS